MNLYSPDKSCLMEVSALRDTEEGIVVEGKIMGAMPMKAIIRPDELRSGLKLISVRLIVKALKMLITGRS